MYFVDLEMWRLDEQLPSIGRQISSCRGREQPQELCRSQVHDFLHQRNFALISIFKFNVHMTSPKH